MQYAFDLIHRDIFNEQPFQLMTIGCEIVLLTPQIHLTYQHVYRGIVDIATLSASGGILFCFFSTN